MHVLTKVFIVLVSIMAVLLVPLVVVYAYNEDGFKARYESAQAQLDTSRAEMRAIEARQGAQLTRLENQLDSLNQAKAELERETVNAEAEIRQLQTEVASAEAMKAEINAQLAKLASGVDTSAALTSNLITELGTLRGDLMIAEREKVELDESLRDVTGQRDVAVAARRALQEELQRLTEEHNAALGTIANAVAQGFVRGQSDVRIGTVPDRSLVANVIGVRRSSDQVLVEIDAGSRDGVQEGWILTVGRGGRFLGSLRIIRVDVNRATGVLTLEDASRGLVDVGDRASASPE